MLDENMKLTTGKYRTTGMWIKFISENKLPI